MTNGGMIGVSAGDGTNYTFGSRSQAGSLSNVQDAVYATLPPGLILAPASGVITGTPQVAGTWSVMFKVTDSFNVSTNKMLPMTIWDDSDGDGIPDWWMYLYFGHPTGLSNDLSRANDDADRDRMPTWAEYLSGTIPTNRDSVLKVVGIGSAVDGAGSVVRWQSVDGKLYRLERGTNLMDSSPFGVLVRTNIPGYSPMNTETDKTAVGTGQWFYRIELE